MTTESLRSFAARKGNAVSYWHKQKELGRLVMVDVGGKQLVDVERSEVLIAATADPAKAHMAGVNEGQRAMHRGTITPPPLPQGDSYRSNTTDSKNATYMQAKTAREVYEAKNAQLEYEERTGKLIKLDAVRSAWAAKITGARDALLQIPSRIAPVLAAESDIVVVTAMLEGELRQALAELSSTEGEI
jgi:hypothetical protein